MVEKFRALLNLRVTVIVFNGVCYGVR